ncbi:hypothetical protein BRADI_1g74970v3 [Brachypodium distachyon]|uniref:Uncharacterized protein n=1 Tax=Brachypodium distachyon TaxID=15368 RepID=I1H9N4_BRADI|nr:hypothetical protein BRADI_1g74970v3 [Brachypodium distachyon]
METKGADELAKMEEKATFMDSAKERLRQFSAPPAVEQYRVSLKNKVYAAGKYTTTRTRQGISLFGEPNIGPIKSIVDHC